MAVMSFSFLLSSLIDRRPNASLPLQLSLLLRGGCLADPGWAGWELGMSSEMPQTAEHKICRLKFCIPPGEGTHRRQQMRCDSWWGPQRQCMRNCRPIGHCPRICKADAAAGEAGERSSLQVLCRCLIPAFISSCAVPVSFATFRQSF